jgi:hypothetical protein
MMARHETMKSAVGFSSAGTKRMAAATGTKTRSQLSDGLYHGRRACGVGCDLSVVVSGMAAVLTHNRRAFELPRGREAG